MQTVATAEKRRKREATDREALDRGSRLGPNSNDSTVLMAFSARGIPVEDIETFGPAQNVRTYKAWRSLRRQVRKGEKSVRLTVWRPIVDKKRIDPKTGEPTKRSCPVSACVFHVSQTDTIGGAA